MINTPALNGWPVMLLEQCNEAHPSKGAVPHFILTVYGTNMQGN